MQIHALTLDCTDTLAQARFWSAALHAPMAPDSDDEEAYIPAHDTTPALLFVRVPETKTTKNRLHLDLQAPPHSTRDTEITRLRTLGARLLADRRHPDGTGWAVLADPEDNEFCVG
ncbi:VOC family protein [Nocardiopsis sp. N85]|uniref:VOC family protein n=1 Tax=Nocardiopsis sp. N85 TaxID=3029400 RepID=UPI00237F3BAC|nr:VOC family protein [Nocardiopsis sp. N85]MDE3722814.1 VOC family protein [Nocardiopsis sp. N85]